MLDDCTAAHVNHFVCIGEANSHHDADLLGGIVGDRGKAGQAHTSSTVRFFVDPTAAPAGMPPARPRVQVGSPSV